MNDEKRIADLERRVDRVDRLLSARITEIGDSLLRTHCRISAREAGINLLAEATTRNKESLADVWDILAVLVDLARREPSEPLPLIYPRPGAKMVALIERRRRS